MDIGELCNHLKHACRTSTVRDVFENQNMYNMTYLGDSSKTKVLGQDTIPPINKVIKTVDYNSSDFSRYVRERSDMPLAHLVLGVDIVRDVEVIDQRNIRVTYSSYIFEKTEEKTEKDHFNYLVAEACRDSF